MAYTKRYVAGFVDKPTLTTPVDSVFLNAVETALLRHDTVDPGADGQVLQWITASSRYGPALLLNKNVDPAAAIDKSKLNLAGQIVNADIAGAANIDASKLNLSAFGAIPTGAILQWSTATPPSGWVICDGSSLLRAGTYAALFGVIGVLYGTVDGTHFTLPDARGRELVGVGTHADVTTLGGSDALAVASRRPKHKHTMVQPTISAPAVTITDPTHTHDVGFNGTSGILGTDTPRGSDSGATYNKANDAAAKATGVTAALASAPLATAGTAGPQTGAEPVDSQAYLVINHIIKI